MAGFFRRNNDSADTEPAVPPAEAAATQPAPAPSPDDQAVNAPISSGADRSALGDVYAKALIELGSEKGTLDSISDQVDALAGMLGRGDDLRRLIDARQIDREQKREMLQRLFESQLDPTLYKFLQVLNEKGRIEALPQVLASFRAMMAERRGIVEAQLYVAKRLAPDEADRVAQRLGEALGGKQVTLHQHEDPSLIGGMKLRVGDRLIDGSLATRLRAMRQQLIRAGREKARSASERVI